MGDPAVYTRAMIRKARENSEREIRSARLTCVEHAQDVDELRDFLAMLGLDQ